MKRLGLLQMGVMFGILIGNQSKSVNPIVDLRAPRSLFEEMHTGMNDVYVSLDSALQASEHDLPSILDSVESGLNQLSAQYDSMVNTTRNNQVYNDDKEFLQKMIDRIDQLINELENSQGNNDVKRDVIGSIRSLCQSLKRQISF